MIHPHPPHSSPSNILFTTNIPLHQEHHRQSLAVVPHSSTMRAFREVCDTHQQSFGPSSEDDKTMKALSAVESANALRWKPSNASTRRTSTASHNLSVLLMLSLPSWLAPCLMAHLHRTFVNILSPPAPYVLWLSDLDHIKRTPSPPSSSDECDARRRIPGTRSLLGYVDALSSWKYAQRSNENSMTARWRFLRFK